MSYIRKSDYQGKVIGVDVEKTKYSTTTKTKEIRTLEYWDEVEGIAEKTFKAFHNNDFVLWHDGSMHGINIHVGKNGTMIKNTCDFSIVRHLFIESMFLEKIDKLLLIKNKDVYKAKFIVRDSEYINSFTYIPCDLNNLRDFLMCVRKEAADNKSLSCENLVDIADKATKLDMKSFKKSLFLPVRYYKWRVK